MTGPEHYLLAERLLAEIDGTPEDSVGAVASVAAQAQVHATLALAAATGVSGPPGAQPQADWDAWLDAASAHVRPGGTT